MDLGPNPESDEQQEWCSFHHDTRYQHNFMQNLERVEIIWGKLCVDFRGVLHVTSECQRS
jgi:hypothetical protein